MAVILPPAGALPVPATDATYAATSCASLPRTSIGGIFPWAKRIWSRTMSRIELCSNPCLRSDANASSRFGPILPWAPASASVWQPAHFWLKRVLPFDASPPVALPPVPQPAAMSTAATGTIKRAAARANA